MERNGLVHLYTGSGKGKTTASLGLAVRAAGQGIRVCVLQFMKGRKACGEHKFIERWPAFEIVQPGSTSYFLQSHDQRLAVAREALARASALLASGDYGLLILDEALTAVRAGLIPQAELLRLIDAKPDGVELVLTGRGATPELVEAADLVTEMVAVKHPLASGIKARKGIEY